ncbi:hypothetical protein DL767_003284 [Monosporascus sp. MG133]|nr:hypothetical protein DL767_003284 [Monosporascus sp. MG133]
MGSAAGCPMTPRSWSTGSADLLRKWTADLGGSPCLWLAGTYKRARSLIESTAQLPVLASAMFDEVPDKDPYRTDPVGDKQVRDYKRMLDLFTVVITEVAPKLSMAELLWLRSQKLKVILNTWRDDVLMTDKSQYVITTVEDGWQNSEALLTIAANTNVTGEKELAFDKLFKCDPVSHPVQLAFGLGRLLRQKTQGY